MYEVSGNNAALHAYVLWARWRRGRVGVKVVALAVTEVGAARRGDGVVSHCKSGEEWAGLWAWWARQAVIPWHPLRKISSGEDRTGRWGMRGRRAYCKRKTRQINNQNLQRLLFISARSVVSASFDRIEFETRERKKGRLCKKRKTCRQKQMTNRRKVYFYYSSSHVMKVLLRNILIVRPWTSKQHCFIFRISRF